MSQQDEILSLRILNSELTERVRVAELALIVAKSNVADLVNALDNIGRQAKQAIKA